MLIHPPNICLGCPEAIPNPTLDYLKFLFEQLDILNAYTLQLD